MQAKKRTRVTQGNRKTAHVADVVSLEYGVLRQLEGGVERARDGSAVLAGDIVLEDCRLFNAVHIFSFGVPGRVTLEQQTKRTKILP